MVTLKHLVVGVHKNLQVLVHKALAQLDGDGLVGHGFLAFFELVVKDVVDALQLRGLTTHHHVDVALFVVGPQVARNHVKLLVEGWLGGHSVLEDDPCRPCGASTEFHHSERLKQALEVLSLEVERLGRRAFHFAAEFVKMRPRALHGFVKTRLAPLRIRHPQDRVLRQEREEGLVGLVKRGVSDVGHDGGPGHLGDAQLRGGVQTFEWSPRRLRRTRCGMGGRS